MPSRLVSAAAGACLLGSIGLQTKMFGAGYETISWRGSLFFFAAMVVLAIIDQWRRPVSAEERISRFWLTGAVGVRPKLKRPSKMVAH